MNRNNNKNRFEDKWSIDVVNRGYVQLQKCLYTCMSKQELNITPNELAVLINIIDRCWNAGDKAFPSVKTLARNIGKSESTVKTLTKSLKKKGFISKEPRYNNSTLYGLEPLAEKLDDHLVFHCKYFKNKIDHEYGGETCLDNPTGRRHEWEHFDKDESWDEDGNHSYTRYWNCVNCGRMYHKKIQHKTKPTIIDITPLQTPNPVPTGSYLSPPPRN